jgi:hypothetical protein
MSEVNNTPSVSARMCGWRAAKKLCLVLILGSSPTALIAAEQTWWFDVEVIIFKRDSNFNELSEKFAHQTIDTTPSKALDLLSAYLRPDLSYLRAGLPFCEASSRAEKQRQFEQDFAFPAPIAEPKPSVEPRIGQGIAAVQQTSSQVVSAKVTQPIPEQGLAASKLASPQSEPTALVAMSPPPQADRASNYVPRDISVKWLEWQIPKQLPCVYSEQLTLLTNPFSAPQEEQDSLKDIASVPIKINGLDWARKGQAFLLPQDQLNLRSLFTSINRQRDLQTMLYAGWRQEVKFGREKAQALRLFAGQNYASTFSSNGHLKQAVDSKQELGLSPYIPLAEHAQFNAQQQADNQYNVAQLANSELFNAIYASLDDANAPLDIDNFFVSPKTQTGPQNTLSPLRTQDTEIWQLEGELKVYLQNVGRTPYLHIDSNFDYRQPVYDASLQNPSSQQQEAIVVGAHNTQPNRLESINVKHFKRVISKQLHYFDHPLFGMVVYISRYQWPEEPQQADDIN